MADLFEAISQLQFAISGTIREPESQLRRALALLDAAVSDPRYAVLRKLKPDEPFFVLRGQDLEADNLVDVWAVRAGAVGCNPDKTRGAAAIAEEMREWPGRKNPD